MAQRTLDTCEFRILGNEGRLEKTSGEVFSLGRDKYLRSVAGETEALVPRKYVAVAPGRANTGQLRQGAPLPNTLLDVPQWRQRHAPLQGFAAT